MHGNMANFDLVIKRFPKQHYFTLFNKDTGFFVRAAEEGYQDPFWAERGPELLDISITNWCDKNCSICYRSSNNEGKIMSLEHYENIISQSSSLGVLQVALGGGNPNQHSQFPQILEITREKYGIVPSYTTNGRGLKEDVIEATKKYCGAVAVSAYYPYNEMVNAINKLTERSIKTNVHFVLTSKTILTAISWLKQPPYFLRKVNALIFLNYKPVGKKVDFSLLLSKSNHVKEFFQLVENKFPFKIGFDSCSVSGLVEYTTIDQKFVEPCEAARFSAFISEDLKMYPCSFAIGIIEGEDLRDKSIDKIWRDSPLFNNFRISLNENQCSKNSCFEKCLGGCPLFKNILLCEKHLPCNFDTT